MESEDRKLLGKINQTVETINNKLNKISENFFLSKLDVVFSVLLALTLFGAGLLLNRTNLYYYPGFVILITFIITLIGEFYAIIKDDALQRYAFWVAFITIWIFAIPLFSFMLFIISQPQGYVQDIYFSIFYLVIGLVCTPIGISWVMLGEEALYEKYVKKLPTRKELLHHSKVVKKIYRPFYILWFCLFLLILYLSR